MLTTTDDPCAGCGLTIHGMAAEEIGLVPTEQRGVSDQVQRFYHPSCAWRASMSLLRQISPVASFSGPPPGNPHTRD